MKKHTNLGDEIFTMKKPKNWSDIIPHIVTMVFLCWVIYSVMLLLEAVMVLNG